MSTISSHILDTARGVPAAGVALRLVDAKGEAVVDARTDDNGRAALPGEFSVGAYTMEFAVGGYFDALSVTERFFEQVRIDFTIAAADAHYHVPLLVSPWGYTTYRGS